MWSSQFHHLSLARMTTSSIGLFVAVLDVFYNKVNIRQVRSL